MSKLFLHAGGKCVSLSDVSLVVTPEPNGSHYPIPHHYLLEEVQHGLGISGWTVRKMSHALQDSNGVVGANYFGIMHLGADEGDDYELTVGLRNSHTKRFSAELLLGTNIFVCDNIAFSGGVKIARKHTLNIANDLNGLILRVIDRLMGRRIIISERHKNYKGNTVTDDEIKAIAFDLGFFGVIPKTKLIKTYREVVHPKYVEHKQYSDTVYGIYMAATEVLKATNRFRLPATTEKLHSILDGVCKRKNEVGLFTGWSRKK